MLFPFVMCYSIINILRTSPEVLWLRGKFCKTVPTLLGKHNDSRCNASCILPIIIQEVSTVEPQVYRSYETDTSLYNIQ